MDTPTPMNDHDLLIEVSTNVKNMVNSLSTYTANTDSRINDHETRLRFVEAENQQLKGAQKNQKMWIAIVGTLSGICGLVLGILQIVRG